MSDIFPNLDIIDDALHGMTRDGLEKLSRSLFDFCVAICPPSPVPNDQGPTHKLLCYDGDTGRMFARLMKNDSRDTARFIIVKCDLQDALRSVIAHTSHLPGANKELLKGLLESCARIAREALKDSDPFERARAIRKGDVDTKMPDYEEFTGWLQRVPETWLPGLLRQCVFSCVGGNVFNESGLVTFVAQAEHDAKNPAHVLRDNAEPA